VGQPTLAWPANTAKINDSTPDLGWSDVTDPSGVTYSLQVDNSSTFNLPEVSVSGLTASHYTTATLAAGTSYWRVKAVDGAGTDSGWTAAWSFTVDTTAPGAPSLLLPANGAKTNDNTPAFDWSDVSDASGVSYIIQIDNNSDFSSPVVDASGLLSSAYTQAIPLADGTYYWRVRAVDGAGNGGNWSTTRNFMVDITAPPIPTLLSPADGAKTNDTTPTLDWSDVTDPSGVSYGLQVDNNDDFSSPAVNASGLAASNYTTAILAQGTYYWRVRAVDGTGGASDWSTAWSLSVDTTAPGVPALVSPASGAKTNNTTPTLDWSDVSDPSGVTYSLQVANNSSFVAPTVNVSGIAVSQYTTTALSPGTYYWRVKTVDGAGNASINWTGSSTFTLDTTAPAVPVLQVPANGAATSDNTPSLDWSDVTDASGISYSLQVASDSGFNSLVVDAGGLSSSAYTTAVLADGTYYWRVRGVDGAGNSSSWTSAWNFTVDTAAPGIPQLLSPASGTRTKDQTPDLDWSDVSDLTVVSYSLQYSTSATFVSNVVNVSGLTASAYTPTTNLAQGTYYWRVKAIDRAGNDSGWSSAWNFIIDTTAPAAPTLVSPTSGATINIATPSLGWLVVTDPSGVSYRVQVASDSGFNSLVVDVSSLAASAYTTAALAQGTWYWRVKAVDGVGNESAWSAQRNFIIDTAPAVPTLLSPANASRIRVSSPNLGWSAVSDPQGVNYSVQVSTTNTFATTVVNVGGLAASNHTTATLAQGTYYWKVRAVDGGGKASDWTASWSFMVDLAPPVVTITLSGATFGGTASSDFAIFLVEYRVDGGGWASASASDGVFDELSEGYFISSLPTLADGTHTIEVRVADVFGDTASASKSFASQQLFYNANQGWNLVTYEGPNKPVSEALGSIMGNLIVAWSYDSEHGIWHGYNPGVPSWANDLAGLEGGDAYWVRVSGGCTWIYEV